MEDIHDLKPLMQLDFPWAALLILTVVVLVFLGVLLWGLRRWWQRRRKVKAPVPQPVASTGPVVDPRETALKKLDQLNPNLGSPDIFYGQLEGILRRFLEDVTQLPVTSYTASELASFFQKKTSGASLRTGALTGFFSVLEHGEQAKFAKGAAAQSMQQEDLETVKTMVKTFKD